MVTLVGELRSLFQSTKKGRRVRWLLCLNLVCHKDVGFLDSYVDPYYVQ